MHHTATSLLESLQVKFVYATQYEFDSSWVMEPRFFPYSVLWYVEEGHAHVTVDGRRYSCAPGSVLHLPYRSIVAGGAGAERIRLISVRFDAAIAAWPDRVWSEAIGFPVVYPEHTAPLLPYFRQLLSLYRTPSAARHLFLQGQLQCLVATMLAALCDRSRLSAMPREKPDPRVHKVAVYLQTHPGAMPTVSQLCMLLRVSPSHLRALFREHTGQAVLPYIHHFKIDQAKRMLLETDERIADIALRLGFDNPHYFSRLFKQLTRHTPKQFRQQNQLL